MNDTSHRLCLRDEEVETLKLIRDKYPKDYDGNDVQFPGFGEQFPWTQTGSRVDSQCMKMNRMGLLKTIGRSATGYFWRITTEGMDYLYQTNLTKQGKPNGR